MSLFDIFKKKKKEEKPKKKIEKKPVKKEKKIEPVSLKPERKEEKIEPEIAKPKKKVLGEAYKILHSPHITEKATKLVDENKYVFKILPNVSKIEIKKAVKNTYGVDVESVRIINVSKKKRKTGRKRKTGYKKGYTKAIVEVKKGQKIEILPR